jgi:hypothetical protein
LPEFTQELLMLAAVLGVDGPLLTEITERDIPVTHHLEPDRMTS